MATITGQAALERNLRKVLDGVQAVLIVEALTIGARRMQGAISMRAPRAAVGGGTLAASIEVEFKFTRGVGVAHVGPSPEGFYGKFLEFGTSKMAARPFMRPAVDEDGAQIIAAMTAYTTKHFATMKNASPSEK